ncbi:hypothetical protein T01_5989 [Trichinella spiralis]|uniref:Uncharacterized protein n=1 Tax=Trichinella spiralis TaxID=6334 RepID=A0A0V0ZMH3_TRISP|nr:hypothetical protein T01_5989 [Trichinella spiralis]
MDFCIIALQSSWPLNAVLCYALALRGALYLMPGQSVERSLLSYELYV